MALPSESEIQQLTPGERIRLIELLWLSFVDEPESLPTSDAQRVELRRRVTAHDAHPEDARPWPEVREELERQ